MSRYLWAQFQKAQIGRDPKAILGTTSSEYEWYQKAQDENQGIDGGFLAPEDWSKTFYDIIRDGGAFRDLPVQRAYARARVQHIPIGASEWTINYLGENTTLTSGDRKFAQRSLTMHKATALATIPTELFRDASAVSDQVFRASAAEMVAFETDRQTLIGNGQGGQPIGVLNATNVGTASLNATPTTANLATGVGSAMALNNSSNVPVGSAVKIAVVAAPRVAITIPSITAAGALPWQFGVGPQASVNYLGVPWVLTASVPVNAGSGTQSFIFYGDWRHLRVVLRDDFEFILSPHPLMSSDQLLCRIIWRYDVQVIHPEAFFVHTTVNQ